MRKIVALCLFVFFTHPRLLAQDVITGRISFYSDKLHGRRMSNGQLYNKDSMTCAHLKLPFGTMLKVKNLRNGKEVVVRVTDRGPFSKRFILDLSKAAAKELGFIRAGHTKAEITILPKEGIPYKLQKQKTHYPKLEPDSLPNASYPTPAWKPKPKE
ncbi:MAG: septal ring lytic transglycosylase RlpA family protein [Bacteroidaceae bacterium]|nr:septal ring lytic transglycosylase RlpA family protein [Bacteroidaceae bacterium]